jgi:proteasome beta subunit
MSTVVAIRSEAGVAIAGDTQTSNDGVVSSDGLRRVFDIRGVGAGVVGETDAIQEFERQFEAALRDREFETSDGLEIESVARIAAREAENADVTTIVAARDSEGTPRIREVHTDGSILEESTIAIGTGAALALGQLEATRLGNDIDDLTAAVRDVIAVVIERDVDTGGDIVVWTLPATEPDHA